ncbi:glucans biosynthesis glucosyltransferase MdoH [Marinobacter sp.]|uniref:glucans biosynthesis glucosyltransferase MdoH n=1 Tax=Marinobacter sp. TaxID=50741 RepID=UPI0035671E1B
MNDTGSWHPVAFRRRLLLATLVAAQTLAGTALFALSLPDFPGRWITTLLIAVFGALFAWIGVGFWTAVFGFVTLRCGGDPWSLSRCVGPPEPASTRVAPTAVVLPICHEPVQRTLGGLRAIYRDLEQQGQTGAVDFYVLSDSRDPEVWLEEQALCAELCDQLGAHHRLFYRRRTVNLNFKSGNIADFLRRWGRRYRYMVVLDADSLLSASCITRLIDLMEARPRAGIIQTMPRLARGQTRFARLQQFANRCYGRLYGAGLAAIQLGEATYWGHNAIIRVAPFMRHCGLRKLRGFGLFKGPVLSHDFIEAALMGRAGYEVWLEPAINGSFEESPPTLEDDLTRDRRWCRGNLQHLWLLATLGNLRFAHRMALVTGIVSYLASPLWLIFLGLSGYVALASPEPTPALPGVLASSGAGSSSGALLLAVTALLLFVPRILAVCDRALAKRTEPFGGVVQLGISTVIETLVALALAPIRMFAHTLHVFSALLNLRLSWQGQNRAGSADWRVSFQRFGPAMTLAGGTLAVIQWHAPGLLPWALPVVLPVLLASLLAGWLNCAPGREAWLRVPEDDPGAGVIELARSTLPLCQHQRWETLSWFEQAVLSPPRARPAQSPPRTIAGRKRQALARLVERCASAGSSGLSQRELSLICNHREAMESLHLRAWRSKPGSPWGLALARMAQSVRWHAGPDLAPEPQRRKEILWIDAAS